MASLEFLVTESNTKKRKLSANETVDFLSVRIGASQMEILENSGSFDFSAKSLTNIDTINPGRIKNPDVVYTFTGDFTAGSGVIENVVGTMPSLDKQSKYLYTITAEGYFDEPSSVVFTDSDTITIDDESLSLRSATGVTFYVIAAAVIKSNDEAEITGPALLSSGNSTNGSSGSVAIAPGDAVPTNATTVMQGIKYTAAPLGGVGNIYSVRNQIDATLTTQTSGSVSQNSVYLVVSGTTGGDFTNVGGTTNPTVGTTFRATNNNTPTSYGDYVLQRIIIAGTGIRLLNRIPAGLTRDQLLSAINQTFNITHDFTAVTDGSSVTQTAAISLLGGAKKYGDVLLGADVQTGYVKVAAPYLTFISADPTNTSYITTEYVQGSSNSPALLMATGQCGGTGNTGPLNIRSGDNDGDGGSGAVTLRSGVVRSTVASGGLNLLTGATQALSTANSGLIQLFSGSIGGLGGSSGALNGGSGAIAASAAAASASGQVTFNSGAINVVASTATTGQVVVASGASVSTSSGGTGQAIFRAGDLTGAGSGTTGLATLRAGDKTSATATGSTGSVTARSGAHAGTGNSGTAFFGSGDVNNGISGTATIRSGNSTGTAGTGTGSFTATSGQVTNASATGATGTALYGSGANAGSGASGQVAIKSGDTVNGNSGQIFINSGNISGTGNSGDITIANGTVQANRNSGNILLSTASTSGTGTGGNITLNANALGSYVSINANSATGSVSINANSGINLNPGSSGVVGINRPLFMTTAAGIQFFNTANTFQTTLAANPSATAGANFYLPQADGSNGQVIGTNGSGQLGFITAPGGWNSLIKINTDNNYVASNRDEILGDTTTAAFTIKLPSTPTQGDRVMFIDMGGTWATNNLTVDRNGNNIQGTATNTVLNVNNSWAEFVYSNSTRGWLIRTQ